MYLYLYCIRRSTVQLCKRGKVPTFRCPVAARCAVTVCQLETLSWRNTHTPVNECARPKRTVPTTLKQLTVDPHRSACTETNITHYCPTTPWLCPKWKTDVSPPLLRGGHGRPLLASGTRGLCTGKDTNTSPEPSESQRSSVHIPGHGLFKFKELHENPWTIPNLLCVCRIVLSPYLGYLIIHQHFYLSLALFTLAGATDMLDGYIARTWPNQKSALGSALDPLADKILISVLYVSLTYAQLIPAPLTALVIFRDIGLIAAVFWVRYKTVPPPVTLSKFFNPCYTTAQLKPMLFSKVNTAIQLFLVAASLAAPVFKYTDSPLLQSLWYITAVTTAASGYSYWHYGRKTVQVLNTKSP
ncbi:unnamed protein product [Lota lota]